MNKPRHSLIYRDAEEQLWWLELALDDQDTFEATLSDNALTFGGFNTSMAAQNFLRGFTDIGHDTPVLDPEIFKYFSKPRGYTDIKTGKSVAAQLSNKNPNRLVSP